MMKSRTAFWRRLLLSSGLCAVIALPAVADDTEIYFGSAGVPTEGLIRPNVLFVLDTSSSMNSTDATNPPITRLQRMKDALTQIVADANNINLGLMRFHRQGGPVLFPISYIDADVSTIETTADPGDLQVRLSQSSDDAEESLVVFPGVVDLASTRLEMVDLPAGAASTDLQVQVASNDDDAEERASNGNMNLTSTDLEFMHDGSNQQIVGVRFRNVTVPQGATITDVHIKFEVDEQKSNASQSIKIDVYGEATDNALVFTSDRYNISNRTKTAAQVDWDDPQNLAPNSAIKTPKLTAIVQEIVDRGASGNPGNWASGNAMVFVFEYDEGSGTRTMESRNGEPAGAAVLEISYNSGTVSADTQMVGMRFRNVAVPQGAIINSASIEFRVAGTNVDPASLIVQGEAEDNTQTFTTTVTDLTGRNKTGAAVGWNPLAWNTLNAAEVTDDLSLVVQEIVDRPGWCGGNAMSFFVSGGATPALRIAQAYENDPGSAPLLRINYDVTTGGCTNTTIQKQVADGNDDAEENDAGGMYLTSSDLELVNDGTAGDQTIGIRFRNVDIPQGATIQGAEIIFTAKNATSTTTSVTVYGEDADDASAYSSNANDIGARTKTTANASWPGLPAWSDGVQYATPDLTGVVQEIVDRAGWAGGSAMAFIIEGSGKRRAWSYNGSAVNAPVLRVSYEGGTGAGGGTIKTVRQRLIEIVDQLQYKSGTPITDTLYESLLYYQGKEVCFGKTRGFGDVAGGPDCQPENLGATTYPETTTSRSQYTRVSHDASWTDSSTRVLPAGCTTDNLNSAACINDSIVGLDPVYNSPIEKSCQANYLVFLSDGDETQRHSETMVNNVTGTGCTGNQCGIDIIEYMRNNDLIDNATLDAAQTVTTYTIGFASDGSPAYLQDMATRGGGSFYTADDTAGLVGVFQTILGEILNAPSSFTAPALTVNAFNRLFDREDVYLSLFKPGPETNWNGNVKKYAICGQQGGCPGGAIFGELMDATGQTLVGLDFKIVDNAVDYWNPTPSDPDGQTVEKGGTGSKIPLHSDRTVLTYLGSDAAPTTPVDLVNVADGNTAITKTLLGDPTMTDQMRTDIIQWIRGQDIEDEDGDNDTDENRWAFQDPLHSQLRPVNYGKDLSQPDPDDQAVLKLFIGTNDGALRMIDAQSGEEDWIFYPQTLLADQNARRINANGPHLYGLDGSPAMWIRDWSYDTDGVTVIDEPDGIIDTATGDFVRVIIGMRRGGSAMYALDVTPDTPLTAAGQPVLPKFMWRIDPGNAEYNALGQTWSRPRITDIRLGTGAGGNNTAETVLIFGGGYDDSQDAVTVNVGTVDGGEVAFGPDAVGNAIYIVDPSNGNRLWWASDPGTGADQPDLALPGMDYSFPADLALIDANGDGETDRIYATDVGGQIWRIDLSSTLREDTNSGSTGARLAAISDYSATPVENDKRKFFYSVDVVSIRDTQNSFKADFDMIVAISGNRAHPLDLDVYNRVFAIRDYRADVLIELDGSNNPTNYPKCVSGLSFINCDGGASPVPIVRGNLFDATDNTIQVGATQSDRDTAQAQLKNKTGWYIDLKEPAGFIGEKGLSRPITLAGKLFFTTFLPTASAALDACTGSEGSGRVYGVSIYTGAAVLDFDLSGGPLSTADRFQSVGGGIPSQVEAVFLEEGVTLLIGTSAGAATVDPDIDLPRGKTFWFQQ